MATTQAVQLQPAAGSASSLPSSGSPIFRGGVDLLLLGGLSFPVLTLLALAPDSLIPFTLVGVWILVDLINHPHFAASYVLFYRSAHRLLIDHSVSLTFKARYVAAGFAIPALLVAYFAWAFASADLRLIGYAGNAMLLLVGWHYAKQGFGILIVDSVYQKRFFDIREKRLLLMNAHACWFAFWILANEYVSERTLWGVTYFSINFPAPVVFTTVAISIATTALTLQMLWRRYAGSDRPLPLAGTSAYLITVYLWLLGRLDPALLLFIPMFHSLQYLLIVARLERNRVGLARSAGLKLLLFYLVCVALGYLGFWNLPNIIDGLPLLSSERFESALVATFSVWVFINIHHYFLDNVIWKKDNPETARHLFSAAGNK